MNAINVGMVTPPLSAERRGCRNQPRPDSKSPSSRLTQAWAHCGRPTFKTRTPAAKARQTTSWLLVVLTLTTLFSPAPVAARNTEAEKTALDGLLAITEAQTRFAVRNGRYATNIADLGFQAAVGSSGQLAMKAAFDADWDNPQHTPASGYFFRVLPIGGQQGNPETNSFWAVAIPALESKDLPLHFTAAHKIQSITFPLVGWWSLRVHGTNRFAITQRLTGKTSPSLTEVGLAYETPDSFPDSTLMRRFLFETARNYPEVVPIPETAPVAPGSTPSRTPWIIAGSVVLFIFLLAALKPRKTR